MPTLLFIEDNVNTAKAMKVMLELRGYTVELAGTVAEAVQAIGGQDFDVVLSDITLPDGTGYDVLQQAGKSIKAIAISGHIGDAARSEAIEKGFAEYVTKPFNINDLIVAIERLR